MSIKEAISEVQKLYKGLGWPSLFSRLKFSAAPFDKIIPHIPEEGVIIDLGCGYGILANMLGMLSEKRRVIGFDLDQYKIKHANRGLRNVDCRHGDITKCGAPQADCIILVHVLHHLTSYESQENLLKSCKNLLNKAGRLVICEVDYKPRWKYLMCYLADHILYPLDTIHFRSSENFISLLKSLDFNVKVMPMHHSTLFSHVTYICKKI